MVRRQQHRPPRRDVLDAGDVEARIGKRQRSHERPQHVIRLEPQHTRHPRRPVPMLHRPAPRARDHVQRRVRVHRVRRADAREQRHVEDAVAAGVAVGKVHAVVVRPLVHGAQLAGAPDEALVQASGVAAVAGSRTPSRSGRRNRTPRRTGRSCRPAWSWTARAGDPRPGSRPGVGARTAPRAR